MKSRFIPLSVPNFRGNELKYVSEAVNTGWVSTGGPYVNRMEEMIVDYVNTPGAVSCQNGTSGLHVALLISGITDRDIVLVPTLTFIAAVNPVKYVGAEPIFMDCDDSLCMDPIKLREYCEKECSFDGNKLIDNRTGKHVKAVLVVHVFGNMADMEQILEISEEYCLKVIEDATEAIGTYYTEGIYAGKYAGTLGDVGVYSFNGNKIITTGGGGMILSNNKEYLEHAKHLTTQAKSDELYYTHDEIGYNYRMTNLQAALGIAQLEQLEGFIDTKIQNYQYYSKKLEGNPNFQLLKFRKGTRSNHWFYGIVCDGNKKRDAVIQYLQEQQVQTRPIWGLIHEQKPYLDAYSYKVEKASDYWSKVVNVPCSTNLSIEDIDVVVDNLLKM